MDLLPNVLGRVFEDAVLVRLKKPDRIAPGELVEEFIQLCGINPDDEEIDFDLIYTAFVNRLENHLLMWRQSDAFPICRLPKSAEEDRRFQDMVRGAIVVWKTVKPEEDWESVEKGLEEQENRLLWCRNGVELAVLGYGFQASEDGSSLYGLEGAPLVHVVVRGPMTPSAINTVREDMERVVPSVLRSVAFLDMKPEKEGAALRYDEIIGLPTVAEPSLQKKKPFLAACLDGYYTDATKKDSMDRRIRNAVHLLVEADAQSSDAIGLSLAVAAIEALLGEHTQELTEKLATNVAVLLEPDLTKRRTAVDFVKKLYGDRSKALHGERLDGEPQTRAKSRHLAAAVLDQVVSRRRFRRNAGFEEETPDELLKDLRDQQYSPGHQGLEETNARVLWG